MKTNPAVIKTPRKNPPNKMPTVDTCTDVDPCASDKIEIISIVKVDNYLCFKILAISDDLQCLY